MQSTVIGARGSWWVRCESPSQGLCGVAGPFRFKWVARLCKRLNMRRVSPPAHWLLRWERVVDERFLLLEELLRGDGMALGVIMRFYQDGPTYAATCPAGRIGPIGRHNEDGSYNTFLGDALARGRVEDLIGAAEIYRPSKPSPAATADGMARVVS